MRIGIIGAGHIGGTLARHFISVGHEVAVSNSRGPATLEELIAELSGSAQATTAEDAARFGDVVVAATGTSRSSTATGPPRASSFRRTCRVPVW